MSKQIQRGHLKDSLVSRFPAVAFVDKTLAWSLMGAMVLVEVITFSTSLWAFITGPTALGLMSVSASVSMLTMGFLALLLWHAFCYYDPRVRKVMTTTTRFTPNGFMRIGFLPIPAAASVGILLFVTSTFVSAGIQPGSMLTVTGGGVFLPWLGSMSCKASSIEDADYLDSWTARFDRSVPFGTDRRSFKSFFSPRGDTNRAMPGACFNAPFEFFQSDVIDPVTGKDRDIGNLVTPEGDTEGRLCMYQCVSWKTINLQTLLVNSGSISVGAGIVVVFTEHFCRMFGLPTVTEDTSAEALQGQLMKIDVGSMSRKVMQPFQASMLFCALPILLLGAFMKYIFVTKVDADGFNTVDYYVTYCLLYSVAMVVHMRLWHLYQCSPQVFTKKIWHEGVDTFIIPRQCLEKWNATFGKGEFKRIRNVGDHLVLMSIDLYQWMHLRGDERAQLLINYCRRPSKDGSNSVKMHTLAPSKVKVTHTVDLGQGTVTCEKIIPVAGGLELELVDWKDEDTMLVNVNIDGKMEKVEISKLEVLEKAPQWESEFFQNFFGKDLEASDMGLSPTKATAPLKQRLIAPTRDYQI